MALVILSAVLCAAAAALWVPPGAGHRVDRLLARTRTVDAHDGSIGARTRSGATVLRTASAALVRRARRAGARGRRLRAAERERVVEVVHALARDIAAGQPPQRALERVLAPIDPHETCIAPRTLSAVIYGGEIPGALREDAAAAPLLLGVSICWEVAMHSGAGLTEALTRLAASARSAAEAQSEIEAQLAGARASARMMSLLPVAGLLLGMALGADPLAWLVGSGLGWGCLLLGGLLTVTGAAWTGHIAQRAERELW